MARPSPSRLSTGNRKRGTEVNASVKPTKLVIPLRCIIGLNLPDGVHQRSFSLRKTGTLSVIACAQAFTVALLFVSLTACDQGSPRTSTTPVTPPLVGLASPTTATTATTASPRALSLL